MLSPDTRLFLRQRLYQFLLPVQLDSGYRHGDHVLVAYIAVIPLFQPGKNRQIQIQCCFIVQIEIGNLCLDCCHLMRVFVSESFQSSECFFFAIHDLIADHAELFWQFDYFHVCISFYFSLSSFLLSEQHVCVFCTSFFEG